MNVLEPYVSDVRLLSLSAWFSWIDESVSVDHSISPTDGNVVDIMPNSMQASLLRKNLSVLSVTYVTCCVSTLLPSLSLPEILRTTAPRILIPLLLAACIFSEAKNKYGSCQEKNIVLWNYFHFTHDMQDAVPS